MQKLGQHFLIDKKILKKIAASLNIRDGDVVVEIGAGHGELTGELVNWRIRKLVLIEKDAELIGVLKKKYSQNKNVKIIHGNALKILSKLINQLTNSLTNCKIVGNIPYYITGKLLRVLGELITQLPNYQITVIVLTIQKEVAERITAKSPKMNLLAAAVKIWAEPKIIVTIPPSAFKPQPKVKSATVRFKIHDSRFTNKELKNYYKFIKILFKQPRKTILNNLSYGLKKPKEEIIKILKKYEVNLGDRPQNLTLQQITTLSKENKLIH